VSNESQRIEAYSALIRDLEQQGRRFDSDIDRWNPGDRIVWQDEPAASPFILTRIDEDERVFWTENDNDEECMTRATNMLRIHFTGESDE